MRYIVECVWSGYTSSQARVCHRTVIEKYLAEALKKVESIGFDDGTCLSVEVRECKPREKVQEMHGYDTLLIDCWHFKKSGYVTVLEIREARKQAKQGG